MAPAAPVTLVLMATMPGVQHLPLLTVMAVYALPIQTNAPVVLQSTLLIAPVTIIKCVFVASRTSLAPSAAPLTLIAMVYVVRDFTFIVEPVFLNLLLFSRFKRYL